MTENKKPLTPDNTPEEAKNSIDKVADKKATDKKLADKKINTTKTPVQKDKPQVSTHKISKLAIFALIIAIAAPVGHYLWQEQQSATLTNQLKTQLSEQLSRTTSASLSQLKNQMEQSLNDQQALFSEQLRQVKEQTTTDSQVKITQLNNSIAELEMRIKQRQPSDWLLHESEYLIRIAARTLWLEHDTTAAIGLLNDADARLTELNDPAFLPVRELIHQDIKALEIMPKLQTDEIVLALMAMNKQVSILPLALVDLQKTNNQEEDFELSDDINDWQSNLSKTWERFLDDFIRVRQRSGSIDPLMAPEQQEHLKQNLSLKLQLAIWAASERKGDIYHKTLADVEQWLSEFFEMQNSYNQRFMDALNTLQKQHVSYNYPSELSSLSAIRSIMKKSLNPLPSSIVEEIKEQNSNESSVLNTEGGDEDNNQDNDKGEL